MVKVSETTYNPCPGDNISVIIVAAGTGSRFGADIPKQFLLLNNKPVLQHTVERFRTALPSARIVLVLSDIGLEIWHDLCRHSGFQSPETVRGGATRSESVHNAIRLLAPDADSQSIVLIHDGARPLVATDAIKRVAEAFDHIGVEAVVPVVPLTEAIALGNPDDGTCTPVDRANFRTVQTPQAFRTRILDAAYTALDGQSMPDDAAIYTAFSGKPLHTVQGDIHNIKITNPADLAIAELLLKK